MTRNVVLITADQWRGDCLSAAGHPVVRTPYLDQLAGRGARFEKAYSAVPSCIPARAALHTGLAQTSHRRTGYRDGVPWEYPVTLASEFGRHGYQTRAIGKLHAFPERNRIGFDEVTLHDGYLHASRVRGVDPRFHDDYLSWLEAQPGEHAGADYADTGLDCNSVVARPWPRAERLHPTNWVVSEAVDFLYRRDVTAPFLLHLSFHRPHPPYDPPAWAFEQFLRAPFEEPVVGDWADALAHWRDDSRADANYATYDAETVHRARAGYYGHMAHIDQQINRFLTALSEFGLADDTWVCFTSDHGEMLGEHRLWRKAYPYEGSARVPLLLAGPSGSLPRGGVVSSALAELRDVMPTLLECAGLPVPGGLDGHSLLPAARGSSRPCPLRGPGCTGSTRSSGSPCSGSPTGGRSTCGSRGLGGSSFSIWSRIRGRRATSRRPRRGLWRCGASAWWGSWRGALRGTSRTARWCRAGHRWTSCRRLPSPTPSRNQGAPPPGPPYRRFAARPQTPDGLEPC
ncbi:arylsulfatase, partial [Streptomyces lasiicapitis]|uniref:arylsulfatase n=1 Tax=Streptomyces lasiicapitis TaxID=1923961 RepID=UPI00331C23BA